MSADNFLMPKGRMHVRAGLPNALRAGRPNRRVRSLSRFDPKPNTKAAKLLNAALEVFSAVDAVIDRREKTTGSGQFTERGIEEYVRGFALSSGVPVVKRASAALASAQSEAGELREKIKLRELDGSDPWKVGLRLRAIDTLKAMTQGERDKLTQKLMGNPAIDPIMAEAIKFAPQSLTGVSEMHRRQLIEQDLQAHHGEDIAKLRELEDLIEASSDVIEKGRDEIRLEAGVLNPRAWDEMAAPFEEKASAPWLKKFRENGVEVVRKMDLEKRLAPLATPEEIETGIFADNLDAYKKLIRAA